ncbi:MAG: hypothetical protein IPP42_07390 [Saprospiraceae bacterium]|nr:hypothetical protein [Saprospiraceae bacterium]
MLNTNATSGKNLYDFPPSVANQRGSNLTKSLIPVIQEPVSNRADEIWNNILDKPVRRKSVSKARDVIDISVIHGDLMYAQYPVMVGHILKDGITGAETAIDYFYEGKLSERNAVGNYPGRVGESLVLFDPDNEPLGAIIIGLGEVTEFNAYRLSKAVAAGVINYAMHMRDNVNNRWLDTDLNLDRENIETSISCLCIGTGYGKIPMGESLKSVIVGVAQANETLESLQGLEHKKIKIVEFIGSMSISPRICMHN